MSIREMRGHEWFCGLPEQVSYGVGRGERLRVDYSLVERAKELKLDESNLIEGLSKI